MVNIAKKTNWLVKTFALLNLARWYNIFLTILSQYLAALFLFNQNISKIEILSDSKLHLMIIASACIIAAGYIINAFYDLEKDLMVKPKSIVMGIIISKEFCLRFYLFLNTLGLVLGLLASLKIFIYFFLFVLALWFYSHKLQKIALIRELSASLLSLASLLSISLHYSLFNLNILVYGLLIFTIIFTREIVKGFTSIKENALFGYQTIGQILGLKRARQLIILLIFFQTIIALGMAYINQSVYVLFYFGILIIVQTAVLIQLVKSVRQSSFRRINNLYKFVIIITLFALILI